MCVYWMCASMCKWRHTLCAWRSKDNLGHQYWPFSILFESVSVGFLLYIPGLMSTSHFFIKTQWLQTFMLLHQAFTFVLGIWTQVLKHIQFTKLTEPPPQSNAQALTLWPDWWWRPLISAVQRQVGHLQPGLHIKF